MEMLASTTHWKTHPLRLAAALLTLLLTVLLQSPALAVEFECRVTGDLRFISLDMPGEEHLCEVSVTYTSGERRVMWYANNDTLFCSAKAYELKDKYENTWGFACEQWPDSDGIDQLSARHRGILDNQLKSVRQQGADEYQVVGLKAAASTRINEEPGTLAIQFFLQDSASGELRDRTHVIEDSGNTWRVASRIPGLSRFIELSDDQQNQELELATALISSISDSGALEIATGFATRRDNETTLSSLDRVDCYGRQVFNTTNDGSLQPRSPHRLVCMGEP